MEAQQVARQWEEWGQLTQPATAESNEFVTVQYAVESFLTSQGPRGRNVEPRTFNTFAVLLNQRLLPYCAANGYMYMREFDNLDVTTKFTESWKNLQPTRNRKNATTPAEPVALGDRDEKGRA